VAQAPARVIVRTVLIVVAVALALYVLYLLREPLRWLFIAAFLAVALSGPVNLLDRYMKRGFAIAIVYLVLLTLPFAVAALFVPPLLLEANNLARNLPTFAAQFDQFIESNSTLADLEQNFNLTEELQNLAASLPGRLGDAANVLRDVGLGIVSSLLAITSILVLCAFMLGSGRHWIDSALRLRPPEQAERLKRVLDRVRIAVANYVGGALLIALLAGVLGFAVLSILGVPFAGPLSVIVGLFSLIPMVGATIAAVLVGLVTLFTDFPTATIVWAIWAVLYQQVENHLIQPQVQRRAVDIHPIVVIVAVLFGATLFGIIGAIVAIPVAASIQITVREYWRLRRYEPADNVPGTDESEPPPASPAEPAPAG
jgi:predicted PurR-regulated permease PerM